jgi:hypothetical protein
LNAIERAAHKRAPTGSSLTELVRLGWIVDPRVSKDNTEKAAPGVSASATITITKVRYPVTSTTTVKLPGVGNQGLPVRSIVGDPMIGVPIGLYAFTPAPRRPP